MVCLRMFDYFLEPKGSCYWGRVFMFLEGSLARVHETCITATIPRVKSYRNTSHDARIWWIDDHLLSLFSPSDSGTWGGIISNKVYTHNVCIVFFCFQKGTGQTVAHQFANWPIFLRFFIIRSEIYIKVKFFLQTWQHKWFPKTLRWFPQGQLRCLRF